MHFKAYVSLYFIFIEVIRHKHWNLFFAVSYSVSHFTKAIFNRHGSSNVTISQNTSVAPSRNEVVCRYKLHICVTMNPILNTAYVDGTNAMIGRTKIIN